MDLAKLRVVDLKQELQNRGLDTKGVKAVLIERLQAAIDSEQDVNSSDGGDVEKSESPESGEPEEESILPDEVGGDEPPDDESPTAPPIEHEEASPVPEEPPEVAVEAAEVAPEEENDPESQDVDEKVEKTDESVEESADKEDKEPEDSNETMPIDEMEKQEVEETKKDEKEASVESKDSRKRRRSHSPTESEQSRRRARRESQAAKPDDFMCIEDEPTLPEQTPILSWVDSDLHLRITGSDFCEGKSLSDGVLGLMWAGARATHGVSQGRVFYEVQLLQRNNRVSFPDEKNLFSLRCGWSVRNSELFLGESTNSFAYDSDGRKIRDAGEAEDYGVKFSVGDVIGIYLDMDATPCTIQYTVNGEDQGVAFEFDKDTLNGEALFPHISTKNITYKVNFGHLENTLLQDYKPRKRHHSHERDHKSRKSSTSDDKEPKRDEKTSAKPTNDGENWDDETATKKEEDVPPAEGEEEEEEEKKKKTEGEDVEMKAAEEEGGSAETAEKSEESVEQAEEAIEEPETAEATEVAEAPKEEAKGEEEKPQPERMETEEEAEKPINRETLPDYIFIGRIPCEELVEGPKRPETRKECEVIIMIGLPGAGKTHWVNLHNEQNPEKCYNIIGMDFLINRMTNRKHSLRSERFTDMSNRSFTVLQEMAQKRRRNYILDQTNVFASAQRRKMKGFGDFKRIAVIVVPDDEEYKKRVAGKKEGGSKDEVTENVLNEMKANFSLPSSDLGWFDEIKYPDLDEAAADTLVDQYNKEGRKAMPPSPKRRQYDDYRDRRRGGRDFGRDDRRWDRGGGDRRDRWMPMGGGGPRGPSGWRPPPPRDYYGGGGYDRRGGDRWGGDAQSWVSGGRRGNERDYRRNDYGGGGGGGHRSDYRSRDRDSRSGGGRYGRDQDFRERRSDNRGGGGDNYRSSHSSSSRSSSSRHDYSSSSSGKRDSGTSSAMKNYSSSAHGGGQAAMGGGQAAAWGAAGGWAGQAGQWGMPAGQWQGQAWPQQQWNAQGWGGSWGYGMNGGNGQPQQWGSWDGQNQPVYTTPNVNPPSDQPN
ncbi:hypothetical protein DMENIID0001_058390 [Sergentomyia squamirostris]